ncbi:SHOCT domain-containing protein [Halobaculum limi]|uniref:SHOCT domain-containing protein n=1 Tax=Halobaculum limi TaxID=3031916 RepID=UPI00240531EC|nr:SHOCT domain-containing protein [Halobaculum sp. YSMS11]
MNERTRRLVDAAPGIVAVATLGVVVLLAIAGFGSAVPVAAVVGWLLLTPLSAILGDVLLSETDDSADADANGASDESAAESDPVERLRRRYAAGDIDDDEFERRLDVLLETEGVDAATARERLRERAGGGDGEWHRERDHELDKEVDRTR